MEKENLTQKSIFVTGASGFVGEHLCRKLHQSGAQKIHALSRQSRSGQSRSGQSRSGQSRSGNPLGLHWHQGDLQDFKTVSALIQTIQPDIVFHLASYVSGSRDLAAVLPTFHNNLASTVNLLSAVTEVGCDRIILAGSMEEPDSQAPLPIPCSPYAAAKWGSSVYAQLFHQLYKTPVVVARLFMIYGPAQKDLQKLIPYTISTLLKAEAPRLSSGHREIDWIYIEDAVEGLLSLAQAPHVDGQSFDIGSGQLVTIRSVIDQLTQLIEPPKPPIFGARPDRPAERVVRARISETLGWQPKISLEEGLASTVEWYRDRR